MEKSGPKLLFFLPDWIITIFRKQVIKQAAEIERENTKILEILNKYKNTFDNLIVSLKYQTVLRLAKNKG